MKKKRSARKTMSNKLDRLWSELVKLRAGNVCEICGKTGSLNSHHIFGKISQIKRFDLLNGICLCIRCHTYGEVSAHSSSYGGQTRFHLLLENLRGKKFLEDLEEKYINPKKYRDSDLEVLLEEFKEEKKKY